MEDDADALRAEAERLTLLARNFTDQHVLAATAELIAELERRADELEGRT